MLRDKLLTDVDATAGFSKASLRLLKFLYFSWSTCRCADKWSSGHVTPDLAQPTPKELRFFFILSFYKFSWSHSRSNFSFPRLRYLSCLQSFIYPGSPILVAPFGVVCSLACLYVAGNLSTYHQAKIKEEDREMIGNRVWYLWCLNSNQSLLVTVVTCSMPACR